MNAGRDVLARLGEVGRRLSCNEAYQRKLMLIVCLAIIATYIISPLGLAWLVGPESGKHRVLVLATKDFGGIKIHERNASHKIEKGTVMELVARTSVTLICRPLTGEAAGSVLALPAAYEASLSWVGVARSRTVVEARTFPNQVASPVKSHVSGQNLLLLSRRGDWFLAVPQKDRTAEKVPGWVAARSLDLPIFVVAKNTKAFDAPGMMPGEEAETIAPKEELPVIASLAAGRADPQILVRREGRYLWIPASAGVFAEQ